jgi:hypothetical protein
VIYCRLAREALRFRFRNPRTKAGVARPEIGPELMLGVLWKSTSPKGRDESVFAFRG